MRNLVLLLLLANLTVAAWWHWTVEPPRGESRLAGDVPRLELLPPPREPAAPPPRRSPRDADAADDEDVNGVEGEVVAPDDNGADQPEPQPPSGAASADAGPSGFDREPRNGSRAPYDDDVTGIVLARAMLAPRDVAPQRCQRVGPFAGDDAVAAARAHLEAAGLSPRTETGEGRAWFGHWVQVFETDPGRAADAAAALHDAGLDDAYVIPGDGTYRVSIGIFTHRDRAAAAAALAASLGLDAQTRDRFRDATVHWLVVETTGEVLPDVADLPVGADGQLPSWTACEARS